MTEDSASPTSPDVEGTTPRRRDAARTRGLLIAAARKLFARNGYVHATVR